jgi:hypothetical protein
MNTPPIEDQFHIKKILTFLPVIVLFVIVFIGLFTWDVITDQMAGFITLIGVFIFVLWVYCGEPKTYLSWLNNGGGGHDKKYLISPPPTDATLTTPVNIGIGVAFGVCIALGLGLGFGSIGIARNTNYNPSEGLKIGGGLFIGLGILGMLYSLWKTFKSDDGASSSSSSSSSFKIPGLASLFAAVAGIYMIVRSTQVENEAREVITKDDSYITNQRNAGATTMLSIGLILQIIGFGLVLFFMLNNKYLHDAPASSSSSSSPSLMEKIVPYLIAGVLFLCGILWIAKSQRWPGFNNDDTAAVDSFDNKAFAAHGGIWTILSAVFLILAAGRLDIFKTYSVIGFIIAAGLFGLFIWCFIDYNKKTKPSSSDIVNSDMANDNSYYNQLKVEVTKELTKKAVNGETVSEQTIKDEMEKRMENIQDKNAETATIVNNLFISLSILIIVCIVVFRNTRLFIATCSLIPTGIDIKRWFLMTNDCETDASSYVKVEDDTIKKIKEDTMNTRDWDDLITKNADTGTNASSLFIRLAKGALWIPFLSVILLVLWVSIIFTNVTTSEKTNVWIANSFSGDMFPKVKELIDTFFIVLIVGLLLCGILLLPMVKEMNSDGLDTMLRFAESIQVWQYKGGENSSAPWSIFVACLIFATIISVGMSTLFKFDLVPANVKWIVAILIVLIAMCSLPGSYFIASTHNVDSAFQNESGIFRMFRLLFTTIYLIPFLIVTVFKLILFAIPALFSDEAKKLWYKQVSKFNFTKWDASETDLTLFGISKLKPSDVSSMTAAAAAAVPAAATASPGTGPGNGPTAAAVDAAAGPAAGPAAAPTSGSSEAKVSAIGKLIKVVLLTIMFVILILTVIYYVYKVGANNRSAEQDAASGGLAAQLNSPTAQAIYVIMAIVAVAGMVAYIRDKFTTANNKTPEDYLFDDYKPEDSAKPIRQLTFSMAHIIYVVLMIIVWVYDTDKDDKNRMSVTGMTVLGIAILFFHYFLEFIDNKKQGDTAAATATATAAADKPVMAPMSNLLTNIRFIVNTIFFIVLCVLAYYKQHSVMVVLVVVMFFFHLTKSILGMKLLRLAWLCIIYIPCLFLGLLTKSQGAVGDTTRPIWIILAIEILLAAILFGGPYLLNYIGASKSQIIAAPVPLRPKHDTGLTTQSPQIFIFHNTGLDRSDSDKAANCAPEEKKRYNYSVSGWFWINNNINAIDKDLEIFNFGGVPKLTYNPGTTDFKVSSKTVSLATGVPNADETVIYNSRFNSHNMKDLPSIERNKFDMLNDSKTADIQILIQKWNYFVINYDGKSMDVFLNNSLVAKSDFFIPDITMQPITSGDGASAKEQGLNGNICNVSFHKEPLTIEQIRWTYNMLKAQDPPMIGMKTIADEVKSTGSTNIYSQ